VMMPRTFKGQDCWFEERKWALAKPSDSQSTDPVAESPRRAQAHNESERVQLLRDLGQIMRMYPLASCFITPRDTIESRTISEIVWSRSA
jgi:hypothetical protein